MGYRKLVIDNVEYQYSVGKTHTKVKGLPAVSNEEIGSLEQVFISPCYKNCGCEPMEYTYKRQVKPKDVAKYIKSVAHGYSYSKPHVKVKRYGMIGQYFKIEE